jgi:hypothetical protein
MAHTIQNFPQIFGNSSFLKFIRDLWGNWGRAGVLKTDVLQGYCPCDRVTTEKGGRRGVGTYTHICRRLL